MLTEPGRTNYDFCFRIFGIDVRVHPGFLVLPVLWGAQMEMGGMNRGVQILIFIAVFFVSILVHELGHSLAFRRFGVHSRISLYWLGGLAIPESSFGSKSRMTPNQQIVVSLAGPLAGFLLAGAFALFVIAAQGRLVVDLNGLMPVVFPDLRETAFSSNQAIWLFLYIGLFCNIFWNLLNLAPVFPLDGGQVSRELFEKTDWRNGLRKSLMFSLCAAIAIALISLTSGDRFVGIFFGFLAYSNYMTLQQMSGRSGGVW